LYYGAKEINGKPITIGSVMTTVNNVTRFLDSRKVSYTVFETPVEKLGALETAEFLNVSLDIIFKTIVLTRGKPRKQSLRLYPAINLWI